MMGPGRILIIHEQKFDCSALKSVLARERYDVIEASLDMGKAPFDAEECCLILLDTLRTAPSALGLPASHPGDGSPMSSLSSASGAPQRFVWRKPRRMGSRGRVAFKAVKLGDKTVVLNARVVRGGLGEVRLTWLECGVLSHLLAHTNQSVPSVDLVRELWPSDPTKGVHSLRAFIKNLRKKIEPDPARPQYIVTDRAIGYRLSLPVPVRNL
jgi:DNA-binding response OmpR family regulator